MGLYDSDRFVCFKGLDSGNGLLVEILILSLDVAYLVTSADEDNPSKATIFTKLYHTRTLVGVIRTAGHVLDSNLVEGLTMTMRPLPSSIYKLFCLATLAMSLNGLTPCLESCLMGFLVRHFGLLGRDVRVPPP